ncbi:hypothetical protein GGS24DRAFT_287863 [Hypoxylon argillaceum]|nr:hypothetical protein GGS24DRAFT_287863 [Hypoxylon argillaceum]
MEGSQSMAKASVFLVLLTVSTKIHTTWSKQAILKPSTGQAAVRLQQRYLDAIIEDNRNHRSDEAATNPIVKLRRLGRLRLDIGLLEIF